MIDLTAKLGKINYIEHKKDSKIYPQTEVILDCIMPTIQLKQKCLSIILIWVMFLKSSSGLLQKFVFFFCFFFFYFS